MKLVKQNYKGAKETWACDDCYKKETASGKSWWARLELVAEGYCHDPEKDDLLCGYCKKPLVSLNVLKNCAGRRNGLPAYPSKLVSIKESSRWYGSES